MSELFNIVERLEVAVSRLETMAAPGGKSVCSAGGPISVCTGGGSVSVCSSGGTVSTCAAGGTMAARSGGAAAPRSACGAVAPAVAPASAAAAATPSLPVTAAAPPPPPPGSSATASASSVPASVRAYDDFLDGAVAQYVSVSHEIGGDAGKQAEALRQAFAAQRRLLVTAAACQRPPDGDAALDALLRPTYELVGAVAAFREERRASPLFNHVCAVSDSASALGWVATVPPAMPAPHVKEMQEAAMFYTNRVLKDHRDKEAHVRWVRAFLAVWTELQAYIREHHTTGLVWSKTGPVASATFSPKAAGGGCPPTPPPPAASLPAAAPGVSPEPRNALFVAINKGEGSLTKGLKHVTEDQKTKNNLGGGGGRGGARAVPGRGPGPGAGGSRPSNMNSKAAPSLPPPLLELEGQRWKVENQVGAENLVIGDTELKQAVYVFKCANSTLQVRGKITSITIDSCKKVGLLFDDVVSIVDIINCKDVKVQVMGKCPTININKTDGCHVYLSRESLECEVISGKSSELNILVPDKDGEYTEIPVPELFKTVLDGGNKLVTTPAEII